MENQGTIKKESFLHNVKQEFKKIIWPDRNTAIKQTVLVIICAIVLGVIVAYLDQLIKLLVSLM